MRYGATEAVAGIDPRVALGQIFAFLGPDGAGKTTTVEILEGFSPANRGHGLRARRRPERRRTRAAEPDRSGPAAATT
jgi:ABC-2 type transport system ATP-binding protein